MQIYGRELRDLLAPSPMLAHSPKERAGAKLRIRNGKQGTYVQGVRRMAVASYAEIEKVQEVGNSNRTVGATLMNATSSRAHTIVTISLTQLIKEDGVSRTSPYISHTHLPISPHISPLTRSDQGAHLRPGPRRPSRLGARGVHGRDGRAAAGGHRDQRVPLCTG